MPPASLSAMGSAMGSGSSVFKRDAAAMGSHADATSAKKVFKRRVSAARKGARPDYRKRHEIIFFESKSILLSQPEYRMMRGDMMRMLEKVERVKGLWPPQADVYHSLRNVFQSSRQDKMAGGTYYTEHGYRKMEQIDAKNVGNVIRVWRKENNHFCCKYIP